MQVLSTSQNITLCSWPLITEIIKKQNLSIQERQAKTASFTPLLTDTEWQNAINGPFQEWLSMLVTAYFHYRYVLMALHLYQEHPERENPASQVPTAFLKRLSQEDPQIHQFKLDSFVKTQWADWQTLFQESAQSTLSQLQQISISIQDTHKQIFITDEPISDVLKDIEGQKVTLPQGLLDKMNLDKYLTIKSMLAIHQSISQQRTTTDADIQKYIKKMKKHFQSTHKQYTTLLNTHQEAINKWLEPFQWDTT